MIEVGEYVRVKDGGIGKVIELFGENGIETDNENIAKGWDGEDISDTYIQAITKHSKNIIDLIEVGDYVNGKEIEEIVNMDITGHGIIERILFYDLDFPIDRDLRCFHDYNIKSIVTKEQFASMEYRLEENK